MWQAFKRCWNKDNYRRAALIALPISLGFLLFLIISGGFFLPQWFLDLILPTAFVGTCLSGATYIARPVDKEPKRAEKIGTVIFAAIGIVVTGLICAAAKIIGIPFAGSLGKLAYAVFGLANISSFAGLGNRLGSCVNKKIPTNERASRITGAVIGAGIGTALCICAKAALVTAASAFIPGAAFVLPAVLSTIVIGSSISSTSASAGDYVSKAYNFTKYACGFSKDPKLNRRIQKQYHEYRGSTVGVVLGITAGIIIAVLMPHVAAGILAVAITGLVITACCSIIGGLCSRIGRVIDGFKKAKKAEKISAEENTLDEKPIPQPTNDQTRITAMLNVNEKKLTPTPEPVNKAGELPPVFKSPLNNLPKLLSARNICPEMDHALKTFECRA